MLKNICMVVITLCIVFLTFLSFLYTREALFYVYGKAFTWGTVFNTGNPGVTKE